MGRTKPIVSKKYVVGLTDGEGCFYVNVRPSPRYKAGYLIQMHFHIKMQAMDRSLLKKVKNTLGCGNVYFQKEQRKNHAQCYRYTVGALRDIINIIIPFFKKYSLQSFSKKKNFRIFCQIAELIKHKRHLTRTGMEKIKLLKANMNRKTIGLA